MHTTAHAPVSLSPRGSDAASAVGLSICIPVFNEEGAISETLTRCLAVETSYGDAA